MNVQLQENIRFVVVIAILLVLSVLSGFVYRQWDLTQERRYTLTGPTKDLLDASDETIYVKVLLDGTFPAGFKRLQRSTREMLDAFRRHNPLIHYEFEDPMQGDLQKVTQRQQDLAKDGITPVRLRIRDKGEATEKLIYPYAIFHFGRNMYIVNLLESERPGVDNEWILNNSIALLEYKFANAIQKLRNPRRRNILFVSGHDELDIQQTSAMESELRRHYNTGRVALDTAVVIPDDIDLVVVARPRKPYSDHDLFLLDQYLVNGGNAIFLLSAVDIALDSISQQTDFIPKPLDLRLDPLLFRLGVRLEPNLVLDLESTRIPLVVGTQGGRAQTELFPWYYHPLVSSRSSHPIVKDIDRINLTFPSTLDTNIQLRPGLSREVLLTSSRYSRIQRLPARVNFEILRHPPDRQRFNNGDQPLVVLIEGDYSSIFENRITEELLRRLETVDLEYRVTNKPCKVLVVSDGDIAKNLVNPHTGEVSPVGYNKFEGFVFQGNQTLFLNAVEYMLDQDGILVARAKEVKLRMLDTVRAEHEATQWRLLNIGLPAVLILIGSLLFNLWRKRKYGYQKK